MNVEAVGLLLLGFLGAVALVAAIVLYVLRRSGNFVGRLFREYIDKM